MRGVGTLRRTQGNTADTWLEIAHLTYKKPDAVDAVDAVDAKALELQTGEGAPDIRVMLSSGGWATSFQLWQG